MLLATRLRNVIRNVSAPRIILFVWMSALSITAPAQEESYNWPSQNLNTHNSRYAELDQINRSNVSSLTESWTFSPGPQDSITQVTPLVANGVMYLHSANTMFALNNNSASKTIPV